jgi:hypothetical protein
VSLGASFGTFFGRNALRRHYKWGMAECRCFRVAGIPIGMIFAQQNRMRQTLDCVERI